MAKLIEHMPRKYKNAVIIKDITSPIDLENQNEENLINDMVNQFTVKTATYALKKYENDLAIEVNTNLSYERRRNKILAKIRGRGTSTTKALEIIAKSYVEIVKIIENNPSYSFLIDLTSNNGFPYLLKDLYEIIEDVKPAHLEVDYKMTSQTHDKLYIGAILLCGEEITVYPYQTRQIESKGNVYIASSISSGAEIVTIEPKEVI